jgi:predicted nucleotidyltransferase
MRGLGIELINEIKNRILQITQPKRIMLFGSAATGHMTRDSDIDLLVLEEKPIDPRKESVSLRKNLRGLGFAFDIIVLPMDSFEENKQLIGSIAYAAQKYGKTIYEAA